MSSYQDDWPKLALEWGEEKLAGWHRELEANPPPSAARQVELNKDISYMGHLLDRIRRGI